MTKLRVYELAKEKKMSSKDMLHILGRLGIEVKSHMSVMEEQDVKKVNDFFAPKETVKNDQRPTTQAKPKENKKPKEKNLKNGSPAASQKASDKKNNFEKPDANSNRNMTASKGNPKAAGASKGKGFAGKSAQTGDLGLKNQPIKKRTGIEKREADFQHKKNYSRRKKQKYPAANQPPSHIKKITLGETIVVQELAKRMAKTSASVIKKLMDLGIMVTLNQEVDAETASIVANEFGIETEIKIEKPITEIEDIPDDPASLVTRPPVVTVMGHVDHGKTSLLDAIRQTNVTASEAGGITQHIGAYQIKINGRKITFLDTPGHEAFTAMRARGAQATDIAILVVAADDGVMPQTIEAINHSKAANVPIIVAINKIDRTDAQIDRIKQQLTEYGIVPEEWGGDTVFVPVSALQKQGIDQLLEMILLVAEINEIRANPNRLARGIVIEAELDKGRGPVATILVQKGTLQVGQNLVAGNVFGKVRAMFDDKGKRIKEAGPSTPVEVLGLASVPEPGDVFDVIEDERLAKEIANQRQVDKKEEEFKQANKIRLDDIFKQMNTEGLKELNLVIKADVHGSAEALRQALERLNTVEVKVNVIHDGVGAISETDVMLATASNAVIIGFNVRPDNNARRVAENEKVEIRLYRIIYEVIDEVKAAMSGLLEPDLKEITLGQAEVRALFKVPKVGVIAGSYVTEGKITNKAKVRVIRDGIVIHEGQLDSLKRFKDDIKEVAQGYECGIGIENFNDLKESDIIEAYDFKEVKREL